jgi:anti-sigma-K factor RskA
VNIKEYIESGILEAYVLGALPEQERAGVAANIAMYPELAQEVAAIEVAMQQFAEATPVAPPAFMQEQIWNAISSEEASKGKPVTKTMPLVPAPKQKVRWQMAAMWLFLLGSVMLNILQVSDRSRLESEQVAIRQQLDTMQASQNRLAQVLDKYRSEQDMMADSMVETIVMKSMLPGHPMAATVYWDKAKNETWLAMKKLPPAPDGMQYQMWVIQDGKPVSMGVLPDEMVEDGTVARLPMEITSSQAFAISLEKDGGNPTPTQVMVLGKVAS